MRGTLLRCCGQVLALALVCCAHGTGTAQSAKPPSGPVQTRPQADPVQPVLLRMQITSNAQVVFQPKPWRPSDALAAAALAAPARQGGLGLEFKGVRATDGARSWLRVQLAGDSVLQFRPRGGGLAVTYRSQF